MRRVHVASRRSTWDFRARKPKSRGEPIHHSREHCRDACAQFTRRIDDARRYWRRGVRQLGHHAVPRNE
jgi:hypothetical protein